MTQTSYKVPKSVRQAAAKGIRLRQAFHRGGLSTQEAGKLGIGSGVARARDLTGGSVSLDTVKRMKSYFARHAVDKDAKGSDSAGYWGDNNNPSNGWISWNLWGGDSGMKWVNSLPLP
jgi:hypothetical protein